MTDLIKNRVTFGSFEVNLTTGELRKNGLKLKLGAQPFEILATLLERPGELVTREELRKKIWSTDTFVDFNHGLNAAVNKLRDTLGDSAEEPRYIETVPRRGYRFIAPLTEQPPGHAAPSSALVHAAPEPPATDIALQPRLQGQEPGPALVMHFPYRIIWALAALVFLVALYFVVDHFVESAANSRELRARVEKALAESAERRPGIWLLDLSDAAGGGARKLIVSGDGRNEGPQPSPDGTRLAFMSNRSGAMEIWTSGADGSNLAQLTSMGGSGSPQWSPDGRWIAFDSQNRSGPGVYFVSAEGGPITTHVEIHAESMVPRWSRDGKWIYFASGENAPSQVWKVPIAGGPAMQVTRHGGFAAFESYDGKTVYYAKTQVPNPEIWEVPVNGGEEKLVSPLLRPSWWANWVVTETGILFLSRDGDRSIEFYDFATRGVHHMSTIKNDSFWLTASRDGRFAWYTQQETAESHATLRQDEQ
jgi:DNA-binding winged helix-turn-helix (wHTH) protein